MTIARHFPDAAALCRAVLDATGPTCLLSFSAGKDSIASWLKLREAGFTRIIPFYMYVVPGLEFVERGLRYYERQFQTPILRLPDPKILRMIRNLVFMPPDRAALVESLPPMPELTFDEIADHVRDVTEAPAGCYVAVGTRAADSLARRTNMKRTGVLNPSRKQFYPVFDWSTPQVVEAIKVAGLKLTPEYKWYGRTFDGISSRFLGKLKEHAPRDYQRILDFFPLAELELVRLHLGGPDAAIDA